MRFTRSSSAVSSAPDASASTAASALSFCLFFTLARIPAALCVSAGSRGSIEGWLIDNFPRDQGFTGRFAEKRSTRRAETLGSNSELRPEGGSGARGGPRARKGRPSRRSVDDDDAEVKSPAAAAALGATSFPAATNARYSSAHFAAVSRTSRFSASSRCSVRTFHQFGLSSSTVRQYSAMASIAGMPSSAFHASQLSWSCVSNSDHGRGTRHGPFVACSWRAYRRSAVSSLIGLTPSGGG